MSLIAQIGAGASGGFGNWTIAFFFGMLTFTACLFLAVRIWLKPTFERLLTKSALRQSGQHRLHPHLLKTGT